MDAAGGRRMRANHVRRVLVSFILDSSVHPCNLEKCRYRQDWRLTLGNAEQFPMSVHPDLTPNPPEDREARRALRKEDAPQLPDPGSFHFIRCGAVPMPGSTRIQRRWHSCVPLAMKSGRNPAPGTWHRAEPARGDAGSDYRLARCRCRPAVIIRTAWPQRPSLSPTWFGRQRTACRCGRPATTGVTAGRVAQMDDWGRRASCASSSGRALLLMTRDSPAPRMGLDEATGRRAEARTVLLDTGTHLPFRRFQACERARSEANRAAARADTVHSQQRADMNLSINPTSFTERHRVHGGAVHVLLAAGALRDHARCATITINGVPAAACE